MANINNSDLTKALIDGAKINIVTDSVPSQIAEKVVPVMEVNPDMLRRCNVLKYVAVAGTIYTAPTNKDFYLSAMTLQGINDAGEPTASNYITITPSGNVATIILRGTLPAVAALASGINVSESLSLSIPIKIERGSNITLNIGSTTGSASIIGYTVEN